MGQEFTVREAANRIHVTISTIYNWIRAGKLNARKDIALGYVIPAEELQKLKIEASYLGGIRCSGIRCGKNPLTDTYEVALNFCPKSALDYYSWSPYWGELTILVSTLVRIYGKETVLKVLGLDGAPRKDMDTIVNDIITNGQFEITPTITFSLSKESDHDKT